MVTQELAWLNSICTFLGSRGIMKGIMDRVRSTELSRSSGYRIIREPLGFSGATPEGKPTGDGLVVMGLTAECGAVVILYGIYDYLRAVSSLSAGTEGQIEAWIGRAVALAGLGVITAVAGLTHLYGQEEGYKALVSGVEKKLAVQRRHLMGQVDPAKLYRLEIEAGSLN